MCLVVDRRAACRHDGIDHVPRQRLGGDDETADGKNAAVKMGKGGTGSGARGHENLFGFKRAHGGFEFVAALAGTPPAGDFRVLPDPGAVAVRGPREPAAEASRDGASRFGGRPGPP